MTRMVPKWLTLQAEIDYLYFCLGQMANWMPRSAIDAMIDKAVGKEAADKKTIRQIVTRMKKLKKALAKETGETFDTTMEDELISATGPDA